MYFSLCQTHCGFVQLMMQMTELDSLNDEMQSELNEIRLLQPESQLEQVEEVKENYIRYMWSQALKQGVRIMTSVGMPASLSTNSETTGD